MKFQNDYVKIDGFEVCYSKLCWIYVNKQAKKLGVVNVLIAKGEGLKNDLKQALRAGYLGNSS